MAWFLAMKTKGYTTGPGIYLHVPFCSRKCLYCSFFSRACGAGDTQKYQRAVKEQIIRLSRLEPWKDLRFSSVFFGGGTPSLLPGEALCELLGLVRDSFQFNTSAPEVSIEVNPATIDLQTLCLLRGSGFNRLSIGVQSMHPAELRALGRTHSAAAARQTLGDAREAGFNNFSVDLMYGLPGQEVSPWRESLEQVLWYGPQHLSLYELTVEQGTPMADMVARGQVLLPDEETILAMMEQIPASLAPYGLQRYEISNYAVPGYECRHNLNYWHNGSYIGLGPSAVSSHHGSRWTTLPDLDTFLAERIRGVDGWPQLEQLGRETYFRETVMIGLRMTAGVDIGDLSHRFGLDVLTYYGPVIHRLQGLGLLRLEGGRLALSRQGMRLADMVMAEFV
ncbi:MAG: coproporphyrinogen III oxidase [Desulfobulbus propionicus]|nr:MAG: coproporphyrinogen III oxidase [Desulfobulbus propionicus]